MLYALKQLCLMNPADRRSAQTGQCGLKVGKDKFTAAQWMSLAALVRDLQELFPAGLRVSGHRDHARKYCPGFDVQTWYYEQGAEPTADQVCEERHR